MNCPACRATGMAASTYAQVERVRVFGVPVTQRTNWVVCSGCQARLLSRRDVIDLPGLTEEELAKVLVPYTSFVSRAVAVLALALGWIPIVGLGLAALAVLLNLRRSVWRVLSWVGFVCGVLSTAAALFAYRMGL